MTVHKDTICIKEIRYTDIGSSFIKHIFLVRCNRWFVNVSYGLQEILFQRIFDNKRFYPCMHAV